MSTLFWARIPLVIAFLAFTVWLVITVFRKGGGTKWL